MTNEIIPYLEMCTRETVSLQQGMNYRLGGTYSFIIMSVRPNAPYRDEVLDDGQTLIYEGHDMPRSRLGADPKSQDQPEFTPTGQRTQNGKFHLAAQQAKVGQRLPELVRVYEKIRAGIWSNNGLFHLVDSWREFDGTRDVFKFKLVVADEDAGTPADGARKAETEPSRLIPTSVKLEVWKRDGGRCVMCGATDELHFDHIIPFSRGGTSLRAENIQLLCARHNLEKRDRIQ
ncbi:MAG: HNH endonuclease [Chloroflexi bacterium]|nr:HNH endonuclease [Chloroflexota bacterium]